MQRVIFVLVLIQTLLNPRGAADQTSAPLASARAALGPETVLAGVRALRLVVKDQDRLGGLPGAAPRPVQYAESRSEILILLPDHFLVSTERLTPVPMRSAPWGFAGKNDIGVQGAGSGARFRESFGYLVLFLLLKVDGVFPFTFAGGSASSLQFRDPNGIIVRADLHGISRVPVRFEYEERERNFAGVLTGNIFRTRIELGDHARAGGLLLPSSIVTFRDDLEVQRRHFEAIEVNPALSVSAFRPK